MSGGPVGRLDQCRRIDNVSLGANTNACHRSMLVLERNAVLEAQIDQRELVHGQIKSFEWQIMKIFASVEDCARVLQAFFEALVIPCCYRVKKN